MESEVQKFLTFSQSLETLLHSSPSHSFPFLYILPFLSLPTSSSKTDSIIETSFPLSNLIQVSSILIAMAAQAVSCSPLVSHRATPSSSISSHGKPCLASFPKTKKHLPRLGVVRAQATNHDNKDTSLDVHYNKDDRGQQQQQQTSMERRPRRTAMDVSPFGMSLSPSFYC